MDSVLDQENLRVQFVPSESTMYMCMYIDILIQNIAIIINIIMVCLSITVSTYF